MVTFCTSAERAANLNNNGNANNNDASNTRIAPAAINRIKRIGIGNVKVTIKPVPPDKENVTILQGGKYMVRYSHLRMDLLYTHQYHYELIRIIHNRQHD